MQVLALDAWAGATYSADATQMALFKQYYVTAGATNMQTKDSTSVINITDLTTDGSTVQTDAMRARTMMGYVHGRYVISGSDAPNSGTWATTQESAVSTEPRSIFGTTDAELKYINGFVGYTW
jgi:hypothetical protein